MNHIDLDRVYCAAIKRGEIFLVENKETKDEQLMVIVQDNILNERLASVLAIPVEKFLPARGVFKNELLLKPTETSLNKAAVCIPYKLEAVNRHRLLAKTGELAPERLQELFHTLDINLGRFRDK